MNPKRVGAGRIGDTKRLEFMFRLPCFARVAYSCRRSIDVAIRASRPGTKGMRG